MDEGGFEPPRANTAVLKTAPLDLTRAPILLEDFYKWMRGDLNPRVRTQSLLRRPPWT